MSIKIAVECRNDIPKGYVKVDDNDVTQKGDWFFIYNSGNSLSGYFISGQDHFGLNHDKHYGQKASNHWAVIRPIKENTQTYTFNSNISIGEKLPEFTQEQIKKEPMFWQAGLDFAKQYGGPITQAFLTKLPEEFKKNKIVFDSRSHMLMKGWYPCIPGYHHDSVIRSRNGQPDYDANNRAKHCMALVNGDICPTEFAIGISTFNKVPDGEIVYKKWHEEVDKQLKDGTLIKFNAPSNRMIEFNWQTWHQGTQCIKDGWRWFGRASIYDDRQPKNELRTQVQVYLEFPMNGW